MYRPCTTSINLVVVCSTVLLPTSDALPTDEAPPTEEDKEVEGAVSKKIRTSMSLDEDDLNELRAPSPNKYLTILRSDNDDIRRSYTDGGMLAPPGSRKKEAGPPVPPRRRR